MEFVMISVDVTSKIRDIAKQYGGLAVISFGQACRSASAAAMEAHRCDPSGRRDALLRSAAWAMVAVFLNDGRALGGCGCTQVD